MNDSLDLLDVPLEIMEYRISSRSLLEWIEDRYKVKVDGDTGLMNDPNTYSEDSEYIVELIERLATVSRETVSLRKTLPALKIIESGYSR